MNATTLRAQALAQPPDIGIQFFQLVLSILLLGQKKIEQNRIEQSQEYSQGFRSSVRLKFLLIQFNQKCIKFFCTRFLCHLKDWHATVIYLLFCETLLVPCRCISGRILKMASQILVSAGLHYPPISCNPGLTSLGTVDKYQRDITVHFCDVKSVAR